MASEYLENGNNAELDKVSVTNLQDIAKGDKVFEEFLRTLLTVDYKARPTADQALKHPFFSALYS